MNLIKSFFAFGIALQLLSCNTQKANDILQKTNAEISVKEGGNWNGKKYEGGVFKNVESMTLDPRHTDHSFDIRFEGPGWESNKIGYRLYLDWRNAIDIFGKKTEKMVLPEIGQDGFESYHLAQDWGSDILKVGKGQGLGSLVRFENGEMLRFDKMSSTSVKVNNTKKNSSVDINYQGWKTLNDQIDLQVNFSIFPDERFTKTTFRTSKDITGLCTGIVKVKKDTPLLKKTSENQKWSYIATYGNQSMFDDGLGMAVFYENSTVHNLIDGPFDHLINFRPTQQKVTYYFLAAWEKEVGGIKTETEFINYLNLLLEKLNSQNTL